MEELLSLKWNNHRSTFLHILSVLRDKQLYTDVTLTCDGKFYGVHKLVLSTCSDYFAAMMEKTLTYRNPIIVLKDVRSKDLEALLDYMYLGEVNVTQNELSSLIKCAESLHIKGLVVPDDDEPKKSLKSDRREPVHTPPSKKRRSAIEEIYSTAIKKLSLSEFASDLQTDVSDMEKRKLRKRRKKVIASDSETSGNETETGSSARKKLRFKKSTFMMPALPSLPSLLMSPVLSTSGSSSHDENLCDCPEVLPLSLLRSPTTPLASKTQLQNTTSSRNDEQSVHLNPLLKKVFSVVENNRRMLEEVLGKLQHNSLNNQQEQQGATQDWPSLPVNFKEDLEALETFISCKDSGRQEMIQQFSKIGGKDAVWVTRRIAAHLLSNKFAERCNWKGRGSKIALSDSPIMDVIRGAVQKTFKSATSFDIDTAFKRWLMYASDREGGRALRRKCV